MKRKTTIGIYILLLTLTARAQEDKPKQQSSNIISLAPICIGGEGVGIGVAYERILDRGGYFSFVLPVSSPFIGYVNYTGTFGREFQTWAYSGERQRILQLSPGLKFYPVGNKGRARYALAALYNYQAGYRESYHYYYGGKYRVDINKMAIMLQNSVNIFPTPHLYIGTELGFGYTFLNEEGVNGLIHRINTDEVVQLAFRIGYRF